MSAFDPKRTFTARNRCRANGARNYNKVAHSSACERVGQQPELSMILGMSLGAFTILHVIITLAGIGSGLIVVGGMFASHRLPVTTALFLLTTALRVPLSHPRPHTGFACRHFGVCDPGGRTVCFIQRAPSRRMALDLRDYCCRVTLFERFCSCRAELRESFSSHCVGSDAV